MIINRMNEDMDIHLTGHYTCMLHDCEYDDCEYDDHKYDDWENDVHKYEDDDGDFMNKYVDIHLKGHYTCRNHQKSWIQKVTLILFTYFVFSFSFHTR